MVLVENSFRATRLEYRVFTIFSEVHSVFTKGDTYTPVFSIITFTKYKNSVF